MKKIVVTWNSATSLDRIIDIYGKNSAYSSASNLYSSSTQGTKLGSIKYGTSTELLVSGDYTYIGLRSKDGALYADQIEIVWEVEESEKEFLVCFHENGKVFSDQFKGSLLQANALPIVEAPVGTVFAGWSTDADCSSASGLVSFPMTIESEEIHLYAVYQYDDSKFVKVTSTQDLMDGDVVIITSSVENVALSTTQNTNNRGQTDLADVGSDEIALSAVSNDVQRLTLVKSGNYYSFYTGSGNLYCASSNTASTNYLKTKSGLEDNTDKWTISFSNGVPTITNVAYNERVLKHNQISNLFSCYKSGQKDVLFYKKNVTSAIYSTAYTTVNFPDDLGYITFCYDKNIILSPALKAFVASEAKSGYINLAEVPSIVPAGEGCLLSAPKGDYTLLVGGEAETLATNYLKGYCGEADYENVVLENDFSYYILTVQNEALVFGKKASDFRVKKNRAYLRIPTAKAASVLSINLGATSIERVVVEDSKVRSIVYDMMGHRVESVTRPGFYIVGGKKVFVK